MATRARPRKKRIRIPTPDHLANVALYYLSRYAASEASLRRVLENRLRRAAMAHPDFGADHPAQESLRRSIDKIVAQHKKSGAINDEAFASMKVHNLRRAGKSSRRIAQQLHAKGIAPATVESALRPDDDATPQEADLAAAQAFAKRKGLGHYRRPSTGTQKHTPEELKRKDAATLARAGFGFDIIRIVLDSDVEWND